MSNTKSIRPAYKGGLKRLDDAYYEGISYVHWTMTLQNKAAGWLDTAHHGALRRILFHALARECLCCPAYCLMPDHGHFLFVGHDVKSKQRLAVNWMRREWNELLSPLCLQHQPYDEVLKEADRERDAFANVGGYILQNPLRAGLVDEWQAWPFSGALFPGYPKLDPRKHNFWTDFWKAHHKHLRTSE